MTAHLAHVAARLAHTYRTPLYKNLNRVTFLARIGSIWLDLVRFGSDRQRGPGGAKNAFPDNYAPPDAKSEPAEI